MAKIKEKIKEVSDILLGLILLPMFGPIFLFLIVCDDYYFKKTYVCEKCGIRGVYKSDKEDNCRYICGNCGNVVFNFGPFGK